jgi:Tol biopolymer transport system component/serine/threonine protein kinase
MVSETVSHYRILEKLGEGGMGVVYKAEDTRLGRTVALKFLPPHLIRDAEARRRFEREARAISALEHPNICTIYDIGQTEDGQTFIAMACYEGQSLRERIRRGPLPVADAVLIAQQVASGLARAHETGVIHRDIKPGNVVVTEDGNVRIVDFGLSKLADESTLTRAGHVVGTVSYMSPEQARGEEADGRTDVWGLGVVLYEMVSGQRPFRGANEQAVLYAIVNKTPEPVHTLRSDTPLALEEIIRRAMSKDPAKRYQSARDMCDDLSALRRQLESSMETQTVALTRRSARVRTVRTTVIAVCIAAAVFTSVWYFWFRGRSERPPWGRPHRVTSGEGWEGHPALSPDGSRIAYASDGSGNLDVYVVDVNGGTPFRVTTGDEDESQPCWFPGGSSLAVTVDRGGRLSVWKTSQLGGGATLLVENGSDPAVSPDGRQIAYSRTMSSGGHRIAVAPLDDPTKEVILAGESDAATDHRFPAWSPDGRWICYSDLHNLWIVPSTGGTPVPLTEGRAVWDSEPAWSSDGDHVFFSSYREGTLSLWRVASSGGEPERLTIAPGGQSRPSVSPDGRRLAFEAGSTSWRLLMRDLDSGEEVRFPGLADAHAAAIAPDAGSIAFCAAMWGSSSELGLQRLEASKPLGSPRRLTDQPGYTSHPSFSPDGEWIACSRVIDEALDIWIVPAEGGQPARFTKHPADDMHPAWSPDGSMLAFMSERGGAPDIWIAPVRQGNPVGAPRRLTSGERSAYAPAWSPDGTLVAYVGCEEDAYDVWSVPSDGSGAERRITNGLGALRVRWRGSMQELLVSAPSERGRTELWSVRVEDGSAQPVVPPIEFGSKYTTGLFDVSIDGRLVLWAREEVSGDVCVLTAGERIY